MNLNNFELSFDEIILERGIDYHASGNVVSLEHNGTEWVAEVAGSRDYTVTVTLSEDGEITDSCCDCPYDFGEYCKHQAAVFYTLKDELESGELTSKKSKNKNLEDILVKLDNETLVSIVMEYAGRNKRMKEELFLRYEEQGDIIKHARNVIRGSINNVKYRGFVEYADAAYAAKGADTILGMIDNKIDSGDSFTAVSLSIVILEEMVDLIGYCDDSNGVVGGAVNEAIERIGEAVLAIGSEPSNSEKLFDMIFNHAQEKRYNGWTDWRIDLLFAILPLCGNRTNRNKMELYIKKKVIETNEWLRNYEEHQRQKMQYEILRQFDGKTAADSYMEQHLDNSDFREIVIQNAISKKSYKKALDLCLDGERKDSSLAGLVRKWQELRYTVYEKSKDIQAQKILGLELLQQGCFDYFLKLKNLYAKDNWPKILQDILVKLKKSGQGGVYLKILLQEKLKPQLLDYCKEYNDTITLYYKHLLPDYKDDVGQIFVKYIRNQAERANGRGHYRSVCDLIREYRKACGNIAAHTIRDELVKENARRPAFLDELSRL